MKKFLSLVLALVMTMSLVTISAGAKDFTDADAINYDEAIAVMSAVKVIDGYPDGSFKPATQLNRGQAAKIICNLVLGPTTASELPTSVAPFKDVTTDNVFAGYIAYCAKEGIVGGYADGTFKPTAPLTGYAFMKMLLGALGYDAEIEGYNDPKTWSIAVAKQALGIGLTAGLKNDFDGTKYVTREEACLYAFNTLKATMVDYDTKTSVNVGDATVVIAGSTAKPVGWDNRNTQTGIKYDGNIDDDGFVQFAEQYFTKLVRKDDADKFMRPANTWVYDKTDIGTYADYTKLVETYKKGVTGKDVYDLLKAATIRDDKLEYYVDGKATTLSKNDLVRSNNDDIGATGTGVLTEIYVDTDKELITIVSINTWLSKATADYSEKKEYAPLKVYTAAKTSVAYNVDVEDVPAVKDVTKDTYYLATISYKDVVGGEVVSVVPAEILSDSTVTKFSAGKDGNGTGLVTKLTTGGEEYKANEKAFYDNDILDTYNEGLLTNATYNVYLDTYGNFIGVDLFQGEKNYVFITGYDRPTSHLSVKKADAAGIFLDGTMKAIQVNVTDTNKNIAKATGDNVGYFSAWDAAGASARLNQWYTYTVDEAGVYTLKPCTRMTKTVKGSAYTMDTANVYVDANQGGYTTRVYGEDNSVFLTVDLGATDFGVGITEVTGVYTGVQSVDLDVDTSLNAQAQCQIVTVYDSDNYIIGAVVVGDAKGSTANFAYILSLAKSEEKIGDTYYWTFEAIQNGEVKTLTAKSKYANTIQALSKNTVQELRFDGDYVTSIKNSAKMYTNYTVPTNGEDIYQIKDGATYAADKLSLQGRTLYVTAAHTDVGLALASDAKAVVIQDENGKSDVKTEFASVADALTRIADKDNDPTNGLQYQGDIIAALNTKGQATWVVFVNKTELKTGSQNGQTNVNQKGSVTATASTNMFGLTNVAFTVVRPEYVPASAAVKVTYDVKVNGVVVAPDQTANIAANTNRVVNGPKLYVADTKDNVTVEITKVEYAAITVKVVDDKGNVLKQTGAPTDALSISGGQIWILPDASAYENGTVTYTVTGTTDTTAPTGNVTLDGTGKQIGAGSFVPKGDQYVVVTITGLNEKAVTYSVTACSDKALSALKTGYTGVGKNLTFTLSATKTSGIAAGESVGLTITPDTVKTLALTETTGVKVVLTIGGEDFEFVYINDNDTSNSPIAVSKVVTVNDNLAVAVKSITPIAAPSIASIVVNDQLGDGVLNGASSAFADTITVKFSEKLATAPSLTSSTLTFGSGSLASDGMSATYTVTGNAADATTAYTVTIAQNAMKSAATSVSNGSAATFTIKGVTATLPTT